MEILQVIVAVLVSTKLVSHGIIIAIPHPIRFKTERARFLGKTDISEATIAQQSLMKGIHHFLLSLRNSELKSLHHTYIIGIHRGRSNEVVLQQVLYEFIKSLVDVRYRLLGMASRRRAEL